MSDFIFAGTPRGWTICHAVTMDDGKVCRQKGVFVDKALPPMCQAHKALFNAGATIFLSVRKLMPNERRIAK